MSQQSICATASLALAWRVDLFVALVTPEAARSWALLVVALVNLCVGITKLDGNVSYQLVLESDSLDARNGLDDRGLSVSDMANGTNVDCCLPGDDFWGKGGQSRDVEVFGLGLWRQRWPLDLGHRCGGFLQSGLQRLLIFDFVIGETRVGCLAFGLDDVVAEFIGLAVCRHRDGLCAFWVELGRGGGIAALDGYVE